MGARARAGGSVAGPPPRLAGQPADNVDRLGPSTSEVDHGGAGAQGVTAVPGFLDLGTTGPVEAGPGPADLVSAYAGTGPEARLDAVMAQPEVEWLGLAGRGRGAGG